MLIRGDKINLDLTKMVLYDEEQAIELEQVNEEGGHRRSYLQIGKGCNAVCAYCYQGKHISSNIDVEEYEEVIKEIADTSDEMFIFGGEPFLHENFCNIVTIFEMLKEKELYFFTNGYFDKEILDYIIEHSEQIGELIITIDGVETTHNRRRPYISGNGFQKVLENVCSLKKQNIPYSIQINIDKENIDEIEILIKELRRKIGKPLDICLNRVLHVSNEISTLQFLENYVKIKKEFKDVNIRINMPTVNKIENILIGNGMTTKRCNVEGTKVYDFVENKIYCCPEIEETLIGTFDKHHIEILQEEQRKYGKIVSKENEQCQRCDMKYICEYGCIDKKGWDEKNCRNEIIESATYIINNLDVIFDYIFE